MNACVGMAPAKTDRRTDGQTVRHTGLLAIGVLVIILSVCPSVRLSALQCPEGTPPPCRGSTTTARAGSVAVLYFAARDSADAYLADGLTEDLTILLARSGGLVVKPSSSVNLSHRRQPRAPARDLRRTLNVR